MLENVLLPFRFIFSLFLLWIMRRKINFVVMIFLSWFHTSFRACVINVQCLTRSSTYRRLVFSSGFCLDTCLKWSSRRLHFYLWNWGFRVVFLMDSIPCFRGVFVPLLLYMCWVCARSLCTRHPWSLRFETVSFDLALASSAENARCF